VALLWLRLQAPFAAFRWMQAGVWRGTSPVIPPSAAWGLVLNLASIETRSDESGETTLVRADAPVLELAIADVHGGPRQSSSLYQQLHTYPVGNSGKEFRERTHGNKYWIAPIRRELLVGFDMVLGVRGPDSVLERVRKGLRGELSESRYGLPFAGDNNLLFDRIDVLAQPPEVCWYTPVRRQEVARARSCRLTIGIDREDASRTTSSLFAPLATPAAEPPAEAWVFVPRAA
jgi:CRISPR-associated protein Cas5t